MAMDNKFKNGLIAGLIIAGLFAAFYAGYRVYAEYHPCPPKDQTLIPQAVWDSIKALADKPPTVHIDTEWVEKPVVIPPQPPLPYPQVIDTISNRYADSLVNKEINVHYDFEVKGTLLNRTWSYKPITLIVKEIDSIPYPQLIEVPKPYASYRSGFYIYGLAGGNAEAFLFGGGMDFITKKGTELGAMYQRFGSNNLYSVKLGIQIRLSKRR